MTNKLHISLTRIVVICICYGSLNSFANAEQKVGVIIPELRAPYKVIFDSVGAGIDKGLKKRTSKLVINKNYNPKDITSWMKKENIDAVITLGSLGNKAAKNVPGNTPVVLGALLSAPGATNKFPGVALTPNPDALFALLSRIDGSRKKIITVYNPGKSQWLIDIAKPMAEKNGLRFAAI